MEIDREYNEDDDCVIKEIPVYLCKGLADNLYLFQFPCKPAESNSCTKNVVSSRIKPESGVIELDNSLNTDCEFYDTYVGEDLAASDPVKQGSKVKVKNHQLLDRITVQSQRSVLKKDITCYSVATMYDGKFCITPFHDVVSFLPTYEHIEKCKKKTNNKAALDDTSSSSEDETEENSPAVQVTVKFSQKRETSKSSHEMSHQHYLTKVAEEPWCETTYLNSSSSTAARLLEGLTNTVSRNRSAMLCLSQKQYLDVLVPPDTTDSATISIK